MTNAMLTTQISHELQFPRQPHKLMNRTNLNNFEPVTISQVCGTTSSTHRNRLKVSVTKAKPPTTRPEQNLGLQHCDHRCNHHCRRQIKLISYLPQLDKSEIKSPTISQIQAKPILCAWNHWPLTMCSTRKVVSSTNKTNFVPAAIGHKSGTSQP